MMLKRRAFMAALALLAPYVSQAAPGRIGRVGPSGFSLVPGVTGVARNIAGGMAVGNHFYSGGMSNGTDTAGNSWLTYVNRAGAPVRGGSVIFSGWCLGLYLATVEYAYTANLTVSAAIEYPIGSTPQPLTVGGASSWVVTPGVNLPSDYQFFNLQIPDGAYFRIRTYWTCPSGVKWAATRQTGLSVVNGQADFSESGTSITNKTTSGTLTGSGGTAFGPTAMVSYDCATPSFMVSGDSHMDNSGAGQPPSGYDGNYGYIGWAAGGKYPHIQAALWGSRAKDHAAAGGMTFKLDLAKKAGITHYFANWQINDYSDSAVQSNPALLTGWISSLAAAMKANGQKVIWPTAQTYSVFSKGSYRSGDTTNASSSGFVGPASLRGYVNNMLRAKGLNIDDYIEVGVMETGTIGQDGGIPIDYTYTTRTSRIPQPSALTVGSGSTTTVIQTNYAGATGTLNGGGFFLSDGTYAAITSNTGSVITLATALSSAPASGVSVTAFLATSAIVQSPSPNTHYTATSQQVLRDQARLKLDTLS